MSIDELKKKQDRIQRVKRTAIQLTITAFTAIYPVFITATSWSALTALLPILGFIALGAVVTDIYNRVKPAS